MEEAKKMKEKIKEYILATLLFIPAVIILGELGVLKPGQKVYDAIKYIVKIWILIFVFHMLYLQLTHQL
jgi:hypothetical protein